MIHLLLLTAMIDIVRLAEEVGGEVSRLRSECCCKERTENLLILPMK